MGREENEQAIKGLFNLVAFSDTRLIETFADDVMSVLGNQGLRRSGSIALGAHHCDFTYKKAGEPKPLSGQYPNRIRVGGT